MFGIKKNITDYLFSDAVRKKAKWKCERCIGDFSNRKEILDCSHFITRGNKRVRWDFDNALSLCRGCHLYFGKNPYEHTKFMEKKLGVDGLEKLILRSTRQWHDQKIDEVIIRIGLKKMLTDLQEI